MSESPRAENVAGASERIIDPWLLSVAIFWGLNTVSNKWLLQAMDPAGILCFRFACCAVVVSVAVWYFGRGKSADPAKPWGMMVLVGLWVGIQQLIFIYALDWTSASEASLLISIAPIWTALIGAATGRELIGLANWLGILAAAAGVGLIVFGGGSLNVDIPTRIQGDLWMVLSSLLYGSFMVYSKGIMKQHGSLRVMSWAFVVGSLVIVPAGLGQFVGADWARFDLLLWAALLYSAFIAGGYGFVVWYRTIARTTPARTAAYQYLVPVVSLIAAAILLGERLAPAQVLGALIVLSGLVLARRRASLPSHSDS